ncbi:MAG TPA: MFS transporter, partial [Homoserinimonas sp.]|nr:MFS transporter [Homoserinimonas sp.]
FSVPASAIGLFLSLWAGTIIVASLPLVRLTAAVDRRTLLVVALAVMAAANTVTALAPSYEVALVSRIVAALGHGAFWSVVMVYATSLVPPSVSGRTVAIVSAGASAATVAGIPLGTLIGQVADWRFVFGGLAAVLGLIAVVIQRRLPASAGAAAAGRARRIDGSIWPVLAAALACTFTAAASFTLFTYISPYLTDVAGLPSGWISALLLLFGGAGICGLVVAAVTADRWPVASLVTMTVMFAIALAGLGLAPQSTPIVVAAILVWGLAIGGLPAMLQARMLAVASPSLRGTSSAMMVVFFNGGIATGATLGGVLERSIGLAGAALVASILAIFAVVSVMASRMLAGR